MYEFVHMVDHMHKYVNNIKIPLIRKYYDNSQLSSDHISKVHPLIIKFSDESTIFYRDNMRIYIYIYISERLEI